MLLILFNVAFTEVVPTVGGERGRGELVSNRYTVTTMLLILFNVAFTEVVPTVGGERGRESLYLTATLSPPE